MSLAIKPGALNVDAMKQKVTKLLMEMWKIVSLLVVCNIIVFVIKNILQF